MTFSGTARVDVPNGTSTYTYSANGDIVDRRITFHDGWVNLPPIQQPASLSLDDFESLVTGVAEWIGLTGQMLGFTIAGKSSIERAVFNTGAPHGDTWSCATSLTYYGATDGTMAFEYDAVTGLVTLEPRDALRITWANINARNALSFDMITYARTGQRPRPGASVVGPAGPQGIPGPQGPAGPSNPLVAWPVESVYINRVNVNPGTTLGGTWVLLNTGAILGGPAGTVWVWRRTA